ncbi:hypothetical protein [Planktothrix phage Pra-JY27]|nr:hypothetical protein [Planktothrix phage Pag-Yong1]WEV89289.1 hypothetical protein [Synechococcus phage MinM2]
MSETPWEAPLAPVPEFNPKKHGRARRDPREEALAARERPSWRPMADLPVPDPQDGFIFRWVRCGNASVADPRNVAKRFAEGWEPVPASSQPRIAKMLGRVGVNADGNIEIGGLMLCRIPEEVSIARREYYSRAAANQMRAVDASFLREQDPRMPKLAPERTSTITSGADSRT